MTNALDVNWLPAFGSEDTVIGGMPLLNENHRTIEWPFYMIENGWYPLVYLGRYTLDDGRVIALYFDVDSEDCRDLYINEPRGDATVAHIEGTKWPDWVDIRKIKITKESIPVWMHSMYTPETKMDIPDWFVDNPNYPANANNFLLQIDDDLDEHLGVGVHIYLYWNNKDEAVLFSDFYF